MNNNLTHRIKGIEKVVLDARKAQLNHLPVLVIRDDQDAQLALDEYNRTNKTQFNSLDELEKIKRLMKIEFV